MADSEGHAGGEDLGGGDGDKEKWVRNKSKRSKIWQHYGISRDGSQVKCDYCPLVLKKYSTTTNQWNHLAHVHNISQTKDDQDASTSNSKREGTKNEQQSIQASFAKATKRDPLNLVLARLSAKDR